MHSFTQHKAWRAAVFGILVTLPLGSPSSDGLQNHNWNSEVWACLKNAQQIKPENNSAMLNTPNCFHSWQILRFRLEKDKIKSNDVMCCLLPLLNLHQSSNREYCWFHSAKENTGNEERAEEIGNGIIRGLIPSTMLGISRNKQQSTTISLKNPGPQCQVIHFVKLHWKPGMELQLASTLIFLVNSHHGKKHLQYYWGEIARL